VTQTVTQAELSPWLCVTRPVLRALMGAPGHLVDYTEAVQQMNELGGPSIIAMGIRHNEPGEPSGVFPTGVAGWMREWDGHAWAESVVSDPRAAALEPWHRRPLAALVHGRFLLWFGCWLVAIALAVVFLRTASIFFAVLGGLIGVLGVLGALLWMVFRRLHLHEAISISALNLWGVGSGVVALLVAVAVESGLAALIHHETPIQGLGIAGPVEETAKILVPVILYLVGRYRDPRAGIALALVSGAMFGLGEEVLYLLSCSTSC
jgi:PrsW family intramembrane metalloprotease